MTVAIASMRMANGLLLLIRLIVAWADVDGFVMAWQCCYARYARKPLNENPEKWRHLELEWLKVQSVER